GRSAPRCRHPAAGAENGAGENDRPGRLARHTHTGPASHTPPGGTPDTGGPPPSPAPPTRPPSRADTPSPSPPTPPTSPRHPHRQPSARRAMPGRVGARIGESQCVNDQWESASRLFLSPRNFSVRPQGRPFGAQGLTAPAANSEDGREQLRGNERPG